MDRTEMAAKLGSVALFANLGPTDLDAIAGRMKEVHFQPGPGDRHAGRHGRGIPSDRRR